MPEGPYDPKQTEKDVYERWERSGFFNPDVCVAKGITKPDAPHYSIVLPPPNETGVLHIGHASMIALEDIFVRFERMRGKKTLWIPGTDHAAIATQARVEKDLEKEGKRRRDLGREAFLEEVKKFTESSRGTILEQTRRMGASLDWSRLAYTLDDTRQEAVFVAFKKLYDLGLIYRGSRTVNWDPKGQTVISDDEIVRVEEKTKFYYLQYGPFTIGTARPETKFGDKYVVMHPDDSRYSQYSHGDTLEVPWINGPITATIIKDASVDPAFGTGVMTITPWHSREDFDIAERHGLSYEQIIDQFGKLLPIAGDFAGLKITEAREKIVEKLASKNLLVRVDENYTHAIATAERSGGIVEPQIMKQWFVAVTKPFTLPHSNIPGIPAGTTTTLKDLMLHVVRERHIEIIPDRFEKVYFHWIENLRDWCISRQIWFGHRIPAWYKDDAIEITQENPGDGFVQDEDTLDTWFSSGLWTFSTLGWPQETPDLKTYHPTTLLETGYDILFFWVARMILVSGALLGDVPFKTVYLHGLVRDEKGQKISKSLGNNIDPILYAEKYGTDALRMALVVGVGPGADNNLGESKILAYKKFANKLWNIARFVTTNLDGFDPHTHTVATPLDQAHKERLSVIIKEVTEDTEKFRVHLAAEKLYHYVWHEFADTIIEESKPLLATSGTEKTSRQALLYNLLHTSLRLLHPFMPFITEIIWSHLPNRDAELLMVSRWPETP